MQTSPVCLSCEHNPGPSSLATRCLLAARNKNGSPTQVREPFEFFLSSSASVCALRKEGHKNHQIRQCEKPLIRIDAGGFRGPGDKSKMAALCKVVHMLDANPRQARNFRISENLLARLHGNHGPTPQLHPHSFDAASIVRAASFLEQ